MTNSIRRLLTQVATFEAQSKAGLTPLPGEMIEFFETAREARLDVRAFDTGMPPAPRAPQLSTPVERIGDSVELRASVPLSRVARLVLDGLPQAVKTAAGEGPRA